MNTLSETEELNNIGEKPSKKQNIIVKHYILSSIIFVFLGKIIEVILLVANIHANFVLITYTIFALAVIFIVYCSVKNKSDVNTTIIRTILSIIVSFLGAVIIVSVAEGMAFHAIQELQIYLEKAAN